MIAMNAGQSKVFIIMTVLLLVAFGANVAYSMVSIIFPPTVLRHGLSSSSVAWIIAGYPIGMVIFTKLATAMLNKCGKKLSLLTGIFSQVVSLILFGYCDNLMYEGSKKYIYFACCFVLRLIQGFGNSCINLSTCSIIAFNYPESM